MTYDQWKCTDPREYEPDPCECSEYEQDWEGRATCGQCGRTWWLTGEELKANARRAEAYDRFVRRAERRQRWLGWFDKLRWAFADWCRRSRQANPDDEIPF